jgi:hypothetical protein
MQNKMKEAIHEIFVRLMGEQMEIWRPVEAVKIDQETYRIISPNPEPKVEKWQFNRDDMVSCQTKTFSDGTSGLIAVRKVYPAK